MAVLTVLRLAQSLRISQGWRAPLTALQMMIIIELDYIHPIQVCGVEVAKVVYRMLLSGENGIFYSHNDLWPYKRGVSQPHQVQKESNQIKILVIHVNLGTSIIGDLKTSI